MDSKEKVLIAGGSGFIGSHLSSLLKEKGFQVSILTRSLNPDLNVNQFVWDVEKHQIDPDAFKNIDYLINLAGTNIAEGRWTRSRKKRILESRTKSTALLYEAVEKSEAKPKSFISASAVGFYGTFTSDKILDELDSNGNDFLANVCVKWEEASMKFQQAGIRTVILRTGVVLAKDGGAFPKMTQSLKFGFIAGIGSGKQYLPWIHLEDLCNLYLTTFENQSMKGSFNAVAPEHITLNDLNSKIKTISKKIRIPNLPGFILKLFLGKMSSILLEGSKISAAKLTASGFKFQYPTIEDALHQLLKR